MSRIIAAAPVLSKFVELDFGTLSAGSVNAEAHGLGAEPKHVLIYAQCVVAEHGYSVGDKFMINPQSKSSASAKHLGVTFDASNVVVRHDGVAALGSAVDDNAEGISNFSLASWKIIVRAWA